MKNITCDQFLTWCKHWNYTIEEGYKAMCFTANIIGQHYGNCVDHAKEVINDDSHSKIFKDLVNGNKDNATRLLFLYNELENSIFHMLEDAKMQMPNCKYHLEIPTVGLCCEAYYKSKRNDGLEWMHFPFCNKENCPLKHPELLEGATLEKEM